MKAVLIFLVSLAVGWIFADISMLFGVSERNSFIVLGVTVPATYQLLRWLGSGGARAPNNRL